MDAPSFPACPNSCATAAQRYSYYRDHMMPAANAANAPDHRRSSSRNAPEAGRRNRGEEVLDMQEDEPYRCAVLLQARGPRASLESGLKRGTASMGNGLDVGLDLNAPSRRPRGVAPEYALDT